MCDVGYLCANFSLPMPLDLGPMYATDRQTSDVRRASSLNVLYLRGGAQAPNNEQLSSTIESKKLR